MYNALLNSLHRLMLIIFLIKVVRHASVAAVVVAGSYSCDSLLVHACPTTSLSVASVSLLFRACTNTFDPVGRKESDLLLMKRNTLPSAPWFLAVH